MNATYALNADAALNLKRKVPVDVQKRILDKLDNIEEKLDHYTERLVRVESNQETISGQVKWAFSLILAGITATFGVVLDYFKRK